MNWTVALVSALYFVWGLGLIAGLPIEQITPIASNLLDFGAEPFWLGTAMVLSASIAVGSYILKGELDFMWLIPQQVLLCSSAFNALLSASSGHYPDGTIKPPIFIFTDQLPMTILMAVHFAILIRKPRDV